MSFCKKMGNNYSRMISKLFGNLSQIPTWRYHHTLEKTLHLIAKPSIRYN